MRAIATCPRLWSVQSCSFNSALPLGTACRIYRDDGLAPIELKCADLLLATGLPPVLPPRTTPSPAFPRPGICRNPLALPPLRHSSAAARPVAMPATPDPGTGHQHAHARPLPARRCSMRQQRTASERSAHCALLHRGRVDLVFSCPSGPTGLLAGGSHAAACFARLSGIRPP